MSSRNESVQAGQYYRHFKGHLVRVINTAFNLETEEEVVVYEHITTGRVFVIPLSIFISEVDHKKYPNINQKYHYTLISPCMFENLFKNSKNN